MQAACSRVAASLRLRFAHLRRLFAPFAASASMAVSPAFRPCAMAEFRASQRGSCNKVLQIRIGVGSVFLCEPIIDGLVSASKPDFAPTTFRCFG